VILPIFYRDFNTSLHTAGHVRVYLYRLYTQLVACIATI